jgi:hypothetical protein
MRPVLRSLLTLFAVAASLGLPAAALAQSAGDEQYTDPFGEEAPASQQQQQQDPAPTPAPEQPAEQPSGTPAPAEGGNGTAEAAPTAEAAQEGSPSLPRTGAPVLLLAAAGYALLLAGVAIRRKA